MVAAGVDCVDSFLCFEVRTCKMADPGWPLNDKHGSQLDLVIFPNTKEDKIYCKNNNNKFSKNFVNTFPIKVFMARVILTTRW